MLGKEGGKTVFHKNTGKGHKNWLGKDIRAVVFHSLCCKSSLFLHTVLGLVRAVQGGYPTWYRQLLLGELCDGLPLSLQWPVWLFF